MSTEGLEGNRTLNILHKAEQGGYGILAQVCYDAQSVIALVRSAERMKSPAMIMLFPITLAYGKGPFLQFCLNAAHQASVPIAVHLDHATDPEHLELALGLAKQGIAFDSIMVDASHAETDEENISLAKPYVDRARSYGIAVEVELGRLEGGEAGLRMISDAKLTNSANADMTGAVILAPSIGNLHGSYLKPPNFRQDMCNQGPAQNIQGRGLNICLHGTDTLPDELFRECIANGISKININSWARDPYLKVLVDALQTQPFPDAIEEGTEAFSEVCDRFMTLFGSAGKAAIT
ncbi:ketose-bisphosphate aldolase [Rhodocollybia butyracea]|uniref:Fructose-bisphosphate aldolase n=1 Tax=Rhodocollybia butyracea TaxID=206335 RepID=A0A9P5Q511_9AGAR|nr:ketose-bisphosphate aldolase [Rhodocollybia butyracea]